MGSTIIQEHGRFACALALLSGCSSPTAAVDTDTVGDTQATSTSGGTMPTASSETGATHDQTSSASADSTSTSTDPTSTTAPGDSSESSTGGPDEDAINAAWQADFFSDAVIHDIAITLSDDAYAALEQDGHSFVSGDVAIDGESVASIGVRLRGKVGSFRPISGKPKFKLDMSEFVPDQRFHGLHAIALNNAVVDCSYLKEPLGYTVFRQAGVQASRTSFARVLVNDAVYGLYVIVEVPDGEFLTDRFPEDDQGNLYDGKYIYDWSTGVYSLLDFGWGVDGLFGLEEGTYVGNTDIIAVSEALVTASGGPIGDGEVVQAMDPLLDWDQWHTSWAAEQWIGHVDGYQINHNNYRVYFRPSDTKMLYVPTDFDYGFINEDEWGVNWSYPAGNLAAACVQDASCRQAQVDAVETLLGGIDAGALGAYLGEMADLTHDDAQDDPRRECGTDDVWAYQDYLQYWIGIREAQVRATWGL